MDKQMVAKNILEELDKVMNINWNMEEVYIRAILKGLKKEKE